MPHEMIEEIQSRKGEKVAIFLTIENATGLVLGAMPAFLLTFQTMPWYVTLPLTIASGALGMLATLEVGGMAFYERLVWWVRGSLKQRMTSARITPEEISGARATAQRDAALALGGSVRLVRGRTQTPVPRPRATPIGRRAMHVGGEPTGPSNNGHSLEQRLENDDANPTAE